MKKLFAILLLFISLVGFQGDTESYVDTLLISDDFITFYDEKSWNEIYGADTLSFEIIDVVEYRISIDDLKRMTDQEIANMGALICIFSSGGSFKDSLTIELFRRYLPEWAKQ